MTIKHVGPRFKMGEIVENGVTIVGYQLDLDKAVEQEPDLPARESQPTVSDLLWEEELEAEQWLY